jgi:DNA helicase-2/ATP-dependent DNA helicase PcrA
LDTIKRKNMYYTADLHIHSHYAKATSPALNLETLYQWATIKGVDVIGTGDFTHPAWFAELKEKLHPEGNGFFTLKDPPKELPDGIRPKNRAIRFCLTTEINCETISNGKLRRIHNLVYAPDFDTAEKISARLSKMCDLQDDGRPTIKLPSRDLLEIVLASSPDAHFIPAHIWTPWFSLLGSVYGYDSIEECFGDLTPHIFALETSLSADPAMTRLFSALDRFALISNSDAHSPGNVGREVNRFDTGLSYFEMFEAIKTRKGFLGTYEFFPELGKYFYDGHRNCKVSFDPAKSNSMKQLCPVCGKPVTVGTSARSEKLADRTVPVTTEHFDYIVPLPEILSEIHRVSAESKTVRHEFSKLISSLGNEFEILHRVPIEDIRKKNYILSVAIDRMRQGKTKPVPGYDGAYGVIHFFDDAELGKLKQPQMNLF